MMDIRLSTNKRHHGLNSLHSSSSEQFWSSDGVLPHFIEITFDHIQYVHHVQLALSYGRDDSYTPKKIDFYCGMMRNQMELHRSESFREPDGYYSIYIKREVQYIYIVVKQNHQDGKDTHIRQLRVMETKTNQLIPANLSKKQ